MQNNLQLGKKASKLKHSKHCYMDAILKCCVQG